MYETLHPVDGADEDEKGEGLCFGSVLKPLRQFPSLPSQVLHAIGNFNVEVITNMHGE